MDSILKKTIGIRAVNQVDLHRVKAFLESIGSTFFFSNVWIGLVAIAIVGIFDYGSALAGVGCALISSIVAFSTNKDIASKMSGLVVLNGWFFGIGVHFFLVSDLSMIAVIIVGASLTPLMVVTCFRILKVFELPVLVFPSLLTTWLIVEFAQVSSHIDLRSLGPVTYGASDFWVIKAVFRGIGQILFLDNVIAGIAIALTLLVKDYKATITGLASSFLCVYVSFLIGVPEYLVYSGAPVFPVFLTILAARSGVIPQCWTANAIAVLSASIVTAFVVALLSRVDLPALSVPYLLIVWGLAINRGHRTGKSDLVSISMFKK